MTKKVKMKKIILFLLVLIIFIVGCTTTTQKETTPQIPQEPLSRAESSSEQNESEPSPSTQTGERKANPEKCPDGIWDEAEQKDPSLCPEDRPNGTSQLNVSLDSQEGKVLSIPSSIENNCIGFKISGPNKTATINLIGAGWVTFMWPHFTWGRIEKEPDIFDFSEMDNLVKASQENNVALLAELQPFADWDQAWDKNCKAKENEYLCKPKDMQAYKRFVSKTVERYDGDGEDDMPGLKIPIKYW